MMEHRCEDHLSSFKTTEDHVKTDADGVESISIKMMWNNIHGRSGYIPIDGKKCHILQYKKGIEVKEFPNCLTPMTKEL
jgi:hypothetical protein